MGNIFLSGVFNKLLVISVLTVLIWVSSCCRLTAANTSQAEEIERIIALCKKAYRLQTEKPDSSTVYFKQAFFKSKKAGNVRWEGLSAKFLANNYYMSSQKDSALYFNEIATKKFIQLNDSVNIADTYIRQGAILKRAGELQLAMEYYFKALEISETLEEVNFVSMTLNNIASVYKQRGELKKAEEYTNKSLNIRLEMADTLGIASCYQNLGNINYEQDKYDKAKEYNLAALELYKKLGHRNKVATLYNNMGSNAMSAAQYEEALMYYEKALALHKELNSRYDYSIALLYYNLGRLWGGKRENEKSLAYEFRAMALAEEIDAKDLQIMILDYLITIYHRTGNLAKEYETYVARDSLYTVINQAKTEETIAELELKYNKEKVEKELFKAQAEHKEKTQQRNWLLLSSLMLFGLFVSLTWAYWQKRRGMILLNRQKQVIEQRNHEKSVLMQELHHRVKNNLQLVSSLLSLQSHQMKDDQAADLVKESQRRVEAMTMIHQALYRGEQNTHIDMKDFLLRLVENLRYAYSFESEKLSLKADLQTVSIIADQAIPLGLILNELLSNVFKHAYKAVQQPELWLTMKQSNDEIHIEVRDNGLGLKDDLSDKSDSFGRNLIQSLIRQLRGSIRTYNEQGCVTEVTVPREQIAKRQAVKTKTSWQKYAYS